MWSDAKDLGFLEESDLESIFGLTSPYTEADISRKFRLISRDVHPDRFSVDSEKEDAKKAFGVLNAAKEYLIFTKNDSQEVTNNPFYHRFNKQDEPVSTGSSGLFGGFHARFAADLGKMFSGMPAHPDKTTASKNLSFKELMCRYYWEADTLEASDYDELVRCMQTSIDFDDKRLEETIGEGWRAHTLLGLVIKQGDAHFLKYLIGKGVEPFADMGEWNKNLIPVIHKAHTDVLDVLRSENPAKLSENLKTLLERGRFNSRSWKKAEVQFLISQQDAEQLTLDAVKALVDENPTLLRYLSLFPCMKDQDTDAFLYEVLLDDYKKYRFLDVNDRANPLIIALVFNQEDHRKAKYTYKEFDLRRHESTLEEEPLFYQIPLNKLSPIFLVALNIIWPDFNFDWRGAHNEPYKDSEEASDVREHYRQLLASFSHRASRPNHLYALVALEVCLVVALVAVVVFLPYTLAIAAAATALVLTSMALASGLNYLYNKLRPEVKILNEHIEKAETIRSASKPKTFFTEPDKADKEKPEPDLETDTDLGSDPTSS